MAYVLGYLYADGNLEYSPRIRGRYIRVTSTDKDRITSIRKLLKSKHSIVVDKRDGNYKDKYLLRIGNCALYNQLAKFGVTPHKSLTMCLPSIPIRFTGDFVRGYFDGDGCVYYEQGRGKTSLIKKRLAVIFTSGSKTFLHQLNILLSQRAGTSIRTIYSYARNAHRLRYSTADSKILFPFIYKNAKRKELYLSRKYAIFYKYLRGKDGHVAKIETRRSAKPLCAGAHPAVASSI